MQSKLQNLSGFRFTPIEIPRRRRDNTGYTNLFSRQCRGWRVWRVCQEDTAISDIGLGIWQYAPLRLVASGGGQFSSNRCPPSGSFNALRGIIPLFDYRRLVN